MVIRSPRRPNSAGESAAVYSGKSRNAKRRCAAFPNAKALPLTSELPVPDTAALGVLLPFASTAWSGSWTLVITRPLDCRRLSGGGLTLTPPVTVDGHGWQDHCCSTLQNPLSGPPSPHWPIVSSRERSRLCCQGRLRI